MHTIIEITIGMCTIVGVFIKTKPLLCVKIISSEKYQFIDQINGLRVQFFRQSANNILTQQILFSEDLRRE